MIPRRGSGLSQHGERPAHAMTGHVEPTGVDVGTSGQGVGSGEDVVDLVEEEGEGAGLTVLASEGRDHDEVPGIAERSGHRPVALGQLESAVQEKDGGLSRFARCGRGGEGSEGQTPRSIAHLDGVARGLPLDDRRARRPFSNQAGPEA
jgi:hypothetical protein